MKPEWEEVCSNSEMEYSSFYEETSRLRVFGGWIVRNLICFDDESMENNGWQEMKSAITFVPDPDHKWALEDE
jgi:hypothetical protein